MLGIENFLSFMVTALFFIMTPGMDTVFVLNKSISQGRKSGITSAIGINAGVLTHVFFSALGLTVIISKSETAFMFVKYAGAAYIFYMGVLKLKSNTDILNNTDDANAIKPSKNDFWSGFFTNSLNPKVALFFLAFFPQFINPSQLEDPVPFILLGLTYAFIGIVWYLMLTVFASKFSETIKSNPKSGVWINRISGFIFVLMGLQIAFG
ncbi:LysE family translocator [Lacinutrix sp. 5H-3-7-4]|uniref:LysE family translocator n=1 Tax=Lacinutrix sp. (strain 5H-3-7-4) TaxID=983544 RepID=UPI00020A39DD|nr:LysE family translocator [Lacinutrix sp. 5H-3-7-4]AEH02067.1 Lysine exporter protein (LYSE/YGGA) [Lacinutrix sp. 5H-3-7-4]